MTVCDQIIDLRETNNKDMRANYRPMRAICEHMRENNGYRYFII